MFTKIGFLGWSTEYVIAGAIKPSEKKIILNWVAEALSRTDIYVYTELFKPNQLDNGLK